MQVQVIDSCCCAALEVLLMPDAQLRSVGRWDEAEAG